MSSLCAHEILLVTLQLVDGSRPNIKENISNCHCFFLAQTLPEYNKENIISYLVWIKKNKSIHTQGISYLL